MAARTVHRVIGAILLASMARWVSAHDASAAVANGDLRVALSGGGGTHWIIAALAVSAGLYAVGIARLWHASAPGRGLRVREGMCFAAGWSLLAIALLGPIDAWAARSFAAHMAQHELLMLFVAPLLVMGRPLAVWAWALPFGQRRATHAVVRHPAWRRCWQFATRPFGATLLQAIALVVWHIPAAFDRAAAHAGLHALQHTIFLAAALSFWWAILGSGQRADRSAAAAAVGVIALFCTMIATGALGALLTFAPATWYHAYADLPMPWAASALEDQQLGGLLMWVPGGTVYLVAALVLMRRVLVRGGIVRRLPPGAAFPHGAR